MNAIRSNKFLVMAVLLGAANTNLAVGSTWTRRADMPTARLCPSTSVVEGKIYAIGGATSIHGTYLPTVEVYDPITDSWARKTNMPTRRNGLATAVVNGKIYAIGGEPTPQASLGTVEEYDPSTDTWTRKADMPTKRTFHCACTVDGRIYAFGGVTAGVPGADSNPSTLEVYDPATDTWVTKRSMLTPRGLAGASAVNGKIYVMGGVVGSTHNPSLSTVEVYDPETDTWTPKANLPTARSFPALCAVNGRIYAIGGGTYGGATFSTVEIYDPETDSWTSGPDMPTARLGFSTSLVNARLYAIGGARDFYPGSGLSIVEEYDLTPPPPDFNGDGLVDIKDLLILIESWGQDDPMTDIAPPPFGDGIVDALDLKRLMSYWEQPVDDPTLIAHWALDEAEGDIAYDSAGVNDAFVVGSSAWQPFGGHVDGALQLDGVDDCVVAGPVLNPADGPFSVLAWIQGGAPGQVVISQSNGANWLRADSASGCLMTELCAWGRNGSALSSDMEILDGNWHR
ncbi:MAG: hypothetical protein JXM79_23310, partial [Sedimentisphaerales bacterium]|nr:hypothetical protein [Sedimentisphaerales bacterium]